MTATLAMTLQALLVRGATVTVADSYDDAGLRGITTTVKSKKLATCNGGSRCAGPWCNGKAVYVVDPRVLAPESTNTAEKKKKTGWRHDARKVCLTHILDKDGNHVVTPETAQTTVNPAGAGLTVAQESVSQALETVTWDQLARAHAASDTEQLAVLARQLKDENERLIRKYVDLVGRVVG